MYCNTHVVMIRVQGASNLCRTHSARNGRFTSFSVRENARFDESLADRQTSTCIQKVESLSERRRMLGFVFLFFFHFRVARGPSSIATQPLGSDRKNSWLQLFVHH